VLLSDHITLVIAVTAHKLTEYSWTLILGRSILLFSFWGHVPLSTVAVERLYRIGAKARAQPRVDAAEPAGCNIKNDCKRRLNCHFIAAQKKGEARPLFTVCHRSG